VNFTDIVKTLAPTVASALGGPLAGAAVTALGGILGLTEPTQEKIAEAITGGRMTSEQIAQIKALELHYQNEEKERGFRYAELVFKDVDSARKANVEGGTQAMLFWLSILLLGGALGCEGWVLFNGYPPELSEMVVGRVLGLMDAITMMVLSYWYGTTNSSNLKNQIIAAKAAK
jgi:hypothetical protein